jgi:hypothetical protein
MNQQLIKQLRTLAAYAGKAETLYMIGDNAAEVILQQESEIQRLKTAGEKK